MVKTQGQLTMSDRIAIEAGLCNKESFRKIAKKLGRHPSTIATEVRQNRTPISARYPYGNDCRLARQCARGIYVGTQNVVSNAHCAIITVAMICAKSMFLAVARRWTRRLMSAMLARISVSVSRRCTCIVQSMRMQR